MAMILMNVYRSIKYVKAHCEEDIAFNAVDAVWLD